jgi:ribosomal protein L17
MRHKVKGRKLGTDASHTKAMLKSLAVAVFTSERIKTTETRAKEVRPLVDKVITWAKRGDVHSRRLAIAAIGDKNLVAKIFNDKERYEGRPGGYTRILKLGPRNLAWATLHPWSSWSSSTSRTAPCSSYQLYHVGASFRGGPLHVPRVHPPRKRPRTS